MNGEQRETRLGDPCEREKEQKRRREHKRERSCKGEIECEG